MGLFARGLLVVLLTTGSPLMAAVLWSTPSNISGDSDVSLTESLVAAYNVGDVGVPSVTLNGVTFAPFEVASGASVGTHGNFELKSEFIFGGLPITTSTNFGSASAPFTSLSSSYQSLLSTGATSTGFQFINLHISGLTAGQSYLFQAWTNNSAEFSSGDSFVILDDAAGSVSVDPNTGGSVGSTGQFVIGTFAATSVAQDIGFGGSIFMPGGNPVLSAFQLRTTVVPEPASMASLLAGFVLLKRTGRANARRG